MLLGERVAERGPEGPRQNVSGPEEDGFREAGEEMAAATSAIRPAITSAPRSKPIPVDVATEGSGSCFSRPLCPVAAKSARVSLVSKAHALRAPKE
jgi:hypothetical protein